jgi:hypothetical protein
MPRKRITDVDVEGDSASRERILKFSHTELEIERIRSIWRIRHSELSLAGPIRIQPIDIHS